MRALPGNSAFAMQEFSCKEHVRLADQANMNAKHGVAALKA
jgi:hypothetical protein